MVHLCVTQLDLVYTCCAMLLLARLANPDTLFALGSLCDLGQFMSALWVCFRSIGHHGPVANVTHWPLSSLSNCCLLVKTQTVVARV